MKSYNIPFDQFAAGPLDKAQMTFVTAVQAIRKSDAESSERLDISESDEGSRHHHHSHDG